jgi:hypothetical protein
MEQIELQLVAQAVLEAVVVTKVVLVLLGLEVLLLLVKEILAVMAHLEQIMVALEAVVALVQ